MQVRLDVSHDNSNVRKVVLKKDALIGRSTSCNLRIASSGISREHCKLLISDDGVFIRDLGSSNGTFVNGKQIPPKEEIRLTPGSKLSIGSVNFVVRFKAPKSQPPEPGSTVDLPPKECDTSAVVATEESTKSTDKTAVTEADSGEVEETVITESEVVEEPEFDIADTAEIKDELIEVSAGDESIRDEALSDSVDAEIEEIEIEEEADDVEQDEFLIEIEDEPELETDEESTAAAEGKTHEDDAEPPDEFAAAEEDETVDDEIEEVVEKPGKLKSLFGLIGRKLKSQKDKPAESSSADDLSEDRESLPEDEAEETIVAETEETIRDEADDNPTIQMDQSELEESDEEQTIENDEEYEYEKEGDLTNFTIEGEENEATKEDDMTDFLNQFGQE